MSIALEQRVKALEVAARVEGENDPVLRIAKLEDEVERLSTRVESLSAQVSAMHKGRGR